MKIVKCASFCVSVLNVLLNAVLGGVCLVLGMIALSGHLSDTSYRENVCAGIALLVPAAGFLAHVPVVLGNDIALRSPLLVLASLADVALLLYGSAICLFGPAEASRSEGPMAIAIAVFNLGAMALKAVQVRLGRGAPKA